jgi:hypothetical protein
MYSIMRMRPLTHSARLCCRHGSLPNLGNLGWLQKKEENKVDQAVAKATSTSVLSRALRVNLLRAQRLLAQFSHIFLQSFPSPFQARGRASCTGVKLPLCISASACWLWCPACCT